VSIQPPTAKAPQRARGRLRVAALLDAGATLFTAKGYEATTMTEIAAHAGASIGSLYQFFPSKEALAEALFTRYAEHAARTLQTLVARAPGMSPTQLADLLIDRMLELRTDRDAAIALTHAVAGIMERRMPLRGAMRQQVATILRAANRQLTARQADAASVLIAQVMKMVPALKSEQEQSRKPLIAEARRMLALYIGHVVGE
jgi:AcrR family transcriptional regulator